MFDAFFDGLAALLAWYYDIWPSYGGAIILLTLTVMLVLTPLTLRGTRSMLRMQQFQPEMKRIQKEFKDDRQRMNEELMAFYKDNGINPLSSCLPLLVQMPVFIVLYQVLSGLTRKSGGETFNPKYLDEGTALYQQLSLDNTMDWLGFDLAISPSSALGDGFLTFLPYGVMIIVVLLSGYVQQAQIQGRSQNQSVNPQQQMIMKILPLFLAVISFTLPAALVLYFVVSNLFRVGQQWLITRTIYSDDAVAAGVIEADAEDKPEEKAKKAISSGSNGSTGTKGKATPSRGSGGSGAGAGKSKGQNKRTTSGRNDKAPPSSSLPQPRPRKKKR